MEKSIENNEYQMYGTGIVRRVDELGRVVIPKETRRILGIVEGTPMEFFVSNGSIILRIYAPENDLTKLLEEAAETLESFGKYTCLSNRIRKTINKLR